MSSPHPTVISFPIQERILSLVTSVKKLKKNVHRRRQVQEMWEMLCEIPSDVVLQILKVFDPKSVENFGLTSQKCYHFVRRHRNLLPKFDVFLSVVFNGRKFEVTASLSTEGTKVGKKNGCTSSDEDRKDGITFKKYQFCNSHLQQIFNDPDFQAFEVQTLLVTTRNNQAINADANFVNWLWRFIIKHSKSLEYISLKNLNFEDCGRPEWSCLIGTLRMHGLQKMEVLQFESCHFPKRSRVYDLYKLEMFTNLKRFQEIYSTAKEEDIKEADEEIQSINKSLLIDFLKSRLDFVDITSANFWKTEHFMDFVTNWCRSTDPKIFKRWSVMKNGDFQTIVNALSQHPNLTRIDVPLIYGQALIFHNFHKPDNQLHIYIERPLYIWICGVSMGC